LTKKEQERSYNDIEENRKGVRKIYVFYADVFLLQNLCLDYAAVMGSNLLLKRGKGMLRLFAVSALCSFLGLVLLLSVRDMTWYQLLTHFVLNTGMVLGCFGIGTKKQFLENWLVTYFMVLLLGGGMEWLREQETFSQYHFMQILLAVVLLFSAVAYLVQFKAFGSHIFPGSIQKDIRQISIRAYWDSGNQLRDPYTGKAVSILSYEKAKELIDAGKDNIRFVPYRSLGEQNGLLRVTDIERLELLCGTRRIVIKNAAIGLAEKGLLEGKDYDMILHASVCGENTEENRSILKAAEGWRAEKNRK